MMRGSKTTAITLAQKCKNIMASNWQGALHTVKADAKGSKEDVYTSKVKYFVKKGKPYIWIPERDPHNINRILDDRCSFAVCSPIPGQIPKLLKYLEEKPAGVALGGDIEALQERKTKLATENLRNFISEERRVVEELSYAVSAILNSSKFASTSRSENLQELLDENKEFCIYKLNISSCTYIDGKGRHHEVGLEEFEAAKSEPLSKFATSLIDGINRSEVRRRALIVLCITLLNKNAKDAYMVSVDRKGFDVLAKVQGPATSDGATMQWKELRFNFNEARDVETFCRRLVDMEEVALKSTSYFSGLG